MVVKGLPDVYKPFIAVTTQSEDIVKDFQKFKQALKNFEDTEQTRRGKQIDAPDTDNVMKFDNRRKSICFMISTEQFVVILWFSGFIAL